MYGRQGEPTHNTHSLGDADGSHKTAFGGMKEEGSSSFLHDPHGQCPSSWHTAADRHSPVFPQHHLPHQPHHGNKKYTDRHHDNSSKDNQNHAWYGHSYGQSNYPPLALWNVPGGRYDACIPSDEYLAPSTQTPENNNLMYNPMRKEYYMHFNGVGFSSHDVTTLAPQYPASTLFIQGHVTAYESETRSASASQDACAYPCFPAICQYPACNRTDCAYSALTYKNYYQNNTTEYGNDMYDHTQSHSQTRHVASITCPSRDPSIKQESRDQMASDISAITGSDQRIGNPYDVTITNDKPYIHRYPDLASAAERTSYDAIGRPMHYI